MGGGSGLCGDLRRLEYTGESQPSLGFWGAASLLIWGMLAVAVLRWGLLSLAVGLFVGRVLGIVP